MEIMNIKKLRNLEKLFTYHKSKLILYFFTSVYKISSKVIIAYFLFIMNYNDVFSSDNYLIYYALS